MKNFSDFLSESKIRGTRGVPDRYISDVERRAAHDMRDAGDPMELMRLVGEATDLLVVDAINPRSTGRERHDILMRYFNGRLTGPEKASVRNIFSQLEELAELIIRNNYGAILDNVDLDIKMITPGGVGQFMDDNKVEKKVKAKPELDKNKEDDIKKKGEDLNKKSKNPTDKSDKSKDDVDINKVKSGIDRSKIANSITQGEGLNTKNILHSDEVKSELSRIFGDQKARRLFSLWDSITKLASKMDWEISIDDKARMMENQPQGMAGACSCEWPDAPKATDDQKKNISDSLENGDLFNDDDDDEGGGSNDAEKDLGELFSQGNPKIKAVGIDFPMLLHETVKGIYQMISAVAIPEDPTLANLVKMGTSSFEDESEDFRYGPYIAGDFRDFVNRNPKALDYPNIREFVYGRVLQLPDEDFFSLIEKILMSKVEGRDNQYARRTIDAIIDEIIEELKGYDYQQAIDSQKDDTEYSESEPEMDGDSEIVDSEMSDIDKLISQSNQPKSKDRELSKSELQKEIDAALDKGDMTLVKKYGEELAKRFPDA